MKKKLILMLISLLCVCGFGVSATLAYLIATPAPVENTFTIGQIKISLNETTGGTYPLIPGATITKDPKVTVEKESESGWLFVKIDSAHGFSNYVTYEMNAVWSPLGGFAGVYYLQYEYSTVDQVFAVLANNQVQIKDTLTEEKMAAIAENPVITFTAYAVQSHSIDEVVDAWNAVSTATNS